MGLSHGCVCTVTCVNPHLTVSTLIGNAENASERFTTTLQTGFNLFMRTLNKTSHKYISESPLRQSLGLNVRLVKVSSQHKCKDRTVGCMLASRNYSRPSRRAVTVSSSTHES